MKRTVALLFLFTTCALRTDAAWYWPFGDDSDKDEPRMSELIEPASRLIDSASDYADEGKVKEAVAEYEKALQELARVELENPDRAGKPEFATVRNKRAYVEGAIENLLIKQAKDNARAVSVTDTSELERRYRAERDARKAAKSGTPSVSPDRARPETKPEKKDPVAEPVKSGEDLPDLKDLDEEFPSPEVDGSPAEDVADEKTPEAESPAEGETVVEPPAEAPVTEEPPVANPALNATSSSFPGLSRLSMSEDAEPETTPRQAVVEERVLQPPVVQAPTRKELMQKAKAALGRRDFAEAKAILKGLLEENPKDAPALNLRAMVEMAEGDYKKAEDTLTGLIDVNPRAWYGHYNLARIILQTRGDAGKEMAARYYLIGRDLCGGPADADLEARLK